MEQSSLSNHSSDYRSRTQPSRILPPGTPAPDFTLHSTPDQTVSLSDFRGQPIILAFYPADWSPVCGDEVNLLNEVLPEFRRHNAELLGISVDGAWCHLAFARDRNLHFPLLADFEPKGAVSRSYGAYRWQEGVSERALFVLDESGTVYWSYLSPIGVNPGADGILDALDSMSEQRAAQANSHPAAATDGQQAAAQVNSAPAASADTQQPTAATAS